MSGAQYLGALVRGGRSSSQALQFQLRSRSRASTSNYLYRTTQRYATTEAVKSSEQGPPTSEPAKDGKQIKPATSTPTHNPTVRSDAPAIQKFASKLREQGQIASTTEPYAAYGTTETLFKRCSAAGDYSPTPPQSNSSEPEAASAPPVSPTPGEALASGSVAKTADTAIPFKTAAGEEIYYPASTKTWHAQYALPPTFSTWAHVTILHLYLLLLRIRQFPASHAKRWEQNLLDHFFTASEERMVTVHGMNSKSIRGKYLKDMFDQYRGAVVSYDEGILKGDAVLATALWRNLFRGREDVDAVALAEVVGWLRRGAKGLSGLEDAEFAAARWKFGDPWSGVRLVEKESKGIKEPFVEQLQAGS